MLNATQKESNNSDVRLRRNRRPKFQQINSFKQLTAAVAINDQWSCLAHKYTIKMASKANAHNSEQLSFWAHAHPSYRLSVILIAKGNQQQFTPDLAKIT